MLKPLLVGIGNPFRGDDAVGLEVARSLESILGNALDVIYCEGDPVDLLDLWSDRDQVFLIDAVTTGTKSIGFLHCFHPLKEPIPASLSSSSTHLIDINQVIELGKALGSIPKMITLFGIESRDFSLEEGISSSLKKQLDSISQTIEKEIQACMK